MTKPTNPFDGPIYASEGAEAQADLSYMLWQAEQAGDGDSAELIALLLQPTDEELESSL